MNVTNGLDTFMLFKEDERSPSAKVSMLNISAKLLNETISKNNRLILPRITTQVKAI